MTIPKLALLTRIGHCKGPANPRKLAVARRTLVASAAVMASAFVVIGKAGVHLNMTPSLPLGLYIETQSGSNLVEFCPAGAAAFISAERGYRTSGICADGGSPLLKPVVARAGDTVEVSQRGLSINRTLLRNTGPLAKDTLGRPLQHFPFGQYRVQPGEVWVASTYNPRSFDSRYYGPIPVSSIRAHLRPLLTE